AGRLVPCGWYPTVGVVGAALGGGFGPFGRRFGLACDHVVAADVVLASGEAVRAAPDLLWALRGAGGGQLAVVTALTLRTRPAPPSTWFAVTWRYEHAADVLDAWQHWAPRAPRTLNAELVLAQGPDPATVPIAVVFGVTQGGPAVLDRLVADVGAPPWRRLVTPMSGPDAARHRAYAGAPAATLPAVGRDLREPPGCRVLRSHLVGRPLPRAVVEDVVASLPADRMPGQYREIEFVPWGGALAEPRTDTAFAHRDACFLVEHNADVAPGATAPQRDAVARWVTRCWSTLLPWATGGVYPNYPDPALADPLRAYHGANLERLVEIKTAYDPDDVFRHAQSVPPLPR
ncbi:MAG TPA: BBE domain-containing protein, partial [Pseudonocardiaceae bacterium]